MSDKLVRMRFEFEDGAVWEVTPQSSGSKVWTGFTHATVWTRKLNPFRAYRDTNVKASLIVAIENPEVVVSSDV